MTIAQRDLPDGIGPDHLHATGGAWTSWLRVLVIAALLAAGLAGWLGGGRTIDRRISSPAADLTVHVPSPIRNGMMFEWRIEVRAKAPIGDVVVAIPDQLWRDMTINSLAPAAGEEQHKRGEFRFHFGPLEAGETLLFKVDGQLNPPHFRSEHGAIRVLDDERELARVDIALKVIP